MLLKFRQGLGGHTPEGAPFNVFPGDEVEWEDEADARRLIAARIAVPVKTPDAETTAMTRRPAK